MKFVILATCMNLQTVTLNGVALPCSPDKVEYQKTGRRELNIGKIRVTGKTAQRPYPSVQNFPTEVRIVGAEVPIFKGGFE